MPQSRIAIEAEATIAVLEAPQQQNNGGAIYTTTSNGDAVNGNIYGSRDEVWLNGGPLHNSGDLPNGTYYVQVTAPGGGVLGRGGPIVVTNGTFRHQLSAIVSHGATPGYADTTNDGGEYKVWVSTDPDFANADTKTDNFKVRSAPVVEPPTTTPVEPPTTTPVRTTPASTTTPVEPATTTPVEPATTTPVEPATTTPVESATTTPVEPPTPTVEVTQLAPAPETTTPSGVAAAAGGALPVTGGAAWATAGLGAVLMAAGVTFNRISRRNKSVSS